MLYLNVGCNFDKELPKMLFSLNEKYAHNNIYVASVYGSLRRSTANIPTARPDFRIPDISIKFMQDYISDLHFYGIRFNYTANSPEPIFWLNQNKYYYETISSFLNRHLRADIVTVSNPVAARRFIENNIPIELSTIMEIRDVNVIEAWLSLSDNVERICLSIERNRDIGFFNDLKQRQCLQNIEVLVNEFCSYKGYPCQGFFRPTCYLIHSHGGNQKGLQDGYPLNWCQDSRVNNPEAYLKARVIFPWDLLEYSLFTGITNFKISGRTLSTEFILKTVEAYMSFGEVIPDNMLDLWGHVEKGTTFKDDNSPLFISSEKLRQSNFMDKWFQNHHWRCSEHSCWKCLHCKKTYDLIIEG